MAGKFRYLNVGLGVILGYVGVKMLLVGEPVEWHPPTYLSLVVIGVVMTVAIVASIKADNRDEAAGVSRHGDGPTGIGGPSPVDDYVDEHAGTAGAPGAAEKDELPGR
jgi:hypothetical protein